MRIATDVPGVADVGSLVFGGECVPVAEGDLRASREFFEGAYRAAERDADPDAMAAAVLGSAGLWANEQRGAAGTELMRARMQHVLRLVDAHSSLALRLRIRLAGEADYAAGQYAAVLEILTEARRSGQPLAQAEALSVAHYCLLGPDHGVRRRELATELIGVSAHTGRRRDLLTGLLWTTVDLFLAGEPHAERRLAELREFLERDDHLAVSFVVKAIEVMLSIRAGRFDEAEAEAGECEQLGAVVGDVNAVPWYGGQLVAIRWYQRRLPELVPMLDELVHSPTLSPGDNSTFAALAVAAAMAGDQRKAVSALARLRGRGLAELPRSSSWLVTMNGAVEAAHLLGDADTSTEAYDLLAPYADLPMVGSLGVACFGSTHHALGVASLTACEPRRAVHHFEEAIRQNLTLGHWPAVLLSRQRLTEATAVVSTAPTTAATSPAPASVDDLGGPTGGSLASARITCTLRGRSWRLELGERSVLVGRSVGMLHLAVLIANPGTDVTAADLVAGVAALHDRSPASDQPLLDKVAAHDYRRRLTKLTAEAGHLETIGRHHDAALARTEGEWLVAQLNAATGIGGRSRRFIDNAERARVAVGKAIRRALNHIDQADPIIGGHLRATVHTGIRCSYQFS